MGNQALAAREVKLTKTLFMITRASLLTWLPFQIKNVLVVATSFAIKFLLFSNSLVNVIIYPFRIS